MIEIDGSKGEGGGQILRTSLALATLKKEPIRIFNIRRNRPNPGLARQHLMSVKAIQELTGGRVEGARQGSTQLTFYPGKIKPGRYVVDIGTAGSISLVLQTLIPACLYSSDNVELIVKGGTDVKWAPPIDYLRYVFLPNLGKMGVRGEIMVERRGYYPKGGGLVKAKIQPVKILKSLNLSERGRVRRVEGIAHSSNLPGHIIEREALAVKKSLPYPCSIELEGDKGYSTGTGIVLWAMCEHSRLGSSALGELGKKAEKVGEEAANKLKDDLSTGAPFDRYMGDQIIPYLALAPGGSRVKVAEVTTHLQTNIQIVEEILGINFKVDGNEIKVKGMGLENSDL